MGNARKGVLMINTKIKLGAAMTAVLLLTGCGNEMPYITDEQMDAVGEYAAVMLLKYDANSRSRLVDDAAIEAYDKKKALMEELEKPAKDKTENGGDETDATENDSAENGEAVAADDNLEDFFALPEGMRLVYSGYEVADSYPQDDEEEVYFTIDATTGKKLLVLKFVLDNPTGQAQSVDFLSYNVSCRVTVNEKESRNALTTMLVNDMSVYTGEVDAQDNRELVLLTELDEDILSEVNSLVIRLKNESQTCTIRLM